jgi:hypothetical protein
MEENDMWMQDRYQTANITENEFNGILDVIEKTYTPIFSKFGAKFNLERDWADSTVNAWANQEGNVWTVHMFGGMARRSEMNVFSFGLVACHEVGHHLAGWPYYSSSPWAANEGSSDYFANFVCAKKVFDYLPTPEISGTAKSKCDTAFESDLERARCYKGLVGGQGLGNLLAALHGEQNPSYDTPDPSQVSKTSDSHPEPQCRLDTYLAGSICVGKIWDDAFMPKTDGYVCNNRPRCWFKPAGDTPPTPTPTPTPGPTPTPDPDDGSDKYAEQLVNTFRVNSALKTLRINPFLECAASAHAQDLGDNLRCSHTGSDGSTATVRTVGCGYKRSRAKIEIIACAFDSADSAVNAWIQDRANRAVIAGRFWKSLGCGSYAGYYVCLLGE